MRDWPAGLVAEMATGSARLAFGLLVQRSDGTQVAMSSADVASTISSVPIDGGVSGSVVFAPSPEGLEVSAVARSAGTEVDNLEGQWLEGGAVTLGDVLAGKWSGAAFTLFVHCWADPSLGIGVYTFGEIGKVKPRSGYFDVEFRDIRQRMQANTTWVAQKDCRWELFSTALGAGGGLCGLSSVSYTFTDVEVTSVNSSRQFALSSLGAEAEDFFGNGIVTFQNDSDSSTDLAGLSVRVREHTQDSDGALITLDLPMVFEIPVGTLVTIKSGCRGRWDLDCRDKYDNLHRFGGEKDNSGPDKAINMKVPT